MNTALRFRTLRSTEILGTEVPVASDPVTRLVGLTMMRRGRAGPGLFIPHCHSVHTFGMLFGLDVAFLDSDRKLIELRRDVPPGRIVRNSQADAVLEVPSP